jgi:hypothetical protein
LATETPVGTGAPTAEWPGQRGLVAAFAVLLLLVAIGPLLFDTDAAPGLSGYFWRRQDLPALVALAAALLAARRWGAGGAAFTPRLAPWWPWLAAALLFAFAWSGHGWLMHGYDLSRDEQMVLFDADILARGELFARLSADWAATGEALNRTFVLPGLPADAWVSGYLPVNAALHAAGAALGDAHATAPLLAAMALLALWASARRLWPGDAAPQVMALLCLLLSAQMLVTATTSYAMTGHLALNLLWLALFLRDRWWAYALLLPVGFLATGLHQPIFHPLFVAPFLLLLAERRQWRVLALLVGGYAAIGLFWLGWPGMVVAAAGPAATPVPATSGADYLTRLFETLAEWNANGFWLMALNLLRFAAWQHVLLLPLAFAAVALRWRSEGLVRALALGPVLTVAALLILLPYQGHGWGYRYLHGTIGNVCLLAGYGWIALRERRLDHRRLVAVSSMATLAMLLWLGWNAHRFAEPYAALDRRIAASDADYVLIDERAAFSASDLVYNPPFLDRRPIRLDGYQLPRGSWSPRLCDGKRVAIVDAVTLAPVNALFGRATPAESPNMAEARTRLRALGCTEAAL